MSAAIIVTTINSSSASWKEPRKIGDYLLWTSGVSDPREAPIYWIDDETLLFSGVPGEKVSDEKLYQEFVKARLFTWKLGEKPKVFMEDRWQSESKKSRFYCADYESIHFSDLRLNDLGLNDKYHTQIIKGKEVKVSSEDYSKLEFKKRDIIKPLPYYQNKNKKYIGRAVSSSRNRDYCPGRTDARMEGRDWVDSSRGEYYLDLAARDFFDTVNSRKFSKVEPVRLIKKETWESWEVDLPPRLVNAPSIQHFQGTGRFFVGGLRPRQLDGPSWKESNCWSFWLVSTKDKKADKFCLPYGEWSAPGATLFMDTKAGPFFYVHKSRPGLYSFNNGKPIKVVKGYLLKTRVSPSGCKIAFSSIPSLKEIILRQKFLITHYVLDVCTSLKGNSK